MEAPMPQAIVEELDKYIVGQKEAKKVVAIALRTRERRRQLPVEMRREIMPKNILMIGPTGVGKTEIARRMAAMINAPFIKVEATKFTEVGYVGRDVESIITDLVETAVTKGYEDRLKEVESKAEKLATEKIIDYICQQSAQPAVARQEEARAVGRESRVRGRRQLKSRRYVAQLLLKRQLEDQVIEIEVSGEHLAPGFLSGAYTRVDVEEEAIFGDTPEVPRNYEGGQRRRVPVREARRILAREEASRLVDFDEVVDETIAQVEENGVVFIDELDKLVGPKVEIGRDVSGEGVQRDLLPIVEGTMVMTRFGPVKTEHILFIAAGSFCHGKPSELIPELQGRLPLRVELSPLSQDDLERILLEPRNALTKQYQALLSTEGVELSFAPEGMREIARLACLMNERTENIGARRLYTIMEKVLEEISFQAPEEKGQKVVVDQAYVQQHVGNLIADEDLSRYIL